MGKGKKVFAIPTILLLVLFLTLQYQKNTEAANIEGAYSVDGKTEVTANFPGLLVLTTSFPNLGFFGEEFNFESDGTFSEALFGFSGTWEQTGNKFNVNFNIDALIESLEELGIEITAEVKKNIFKGKLKEDGTIGGRIKFRLDISFDFQGYSGNGSINITSNFTGKPSDGSSTSITQEGRSSAKSIIKRLILRISNSISHRKGELIQQ